MHDASRVEWPLGVPSEVLRLTGTHRCRRVHARWNFQRPPWPGVNTSTKLSAQEGLLLEASLQTPSRLPSTNRPERSRRYRHRADSATESLDDGVGALARPTLQPRPLGPGRHGSSLWWPLLAESTDNSRNWSGYLGKGNHVLPEELGHKCLSLNPQQKGWRLLQHAVLAGRLAEVEVRQEAAGIAAVS